MSMQLTRRAMALTFTTVLAATPLWADDPTVKMLDVDAELSGVEGANALDYYPAIEADLAQAVAGKVALSDDPNGYDVKVTLQQVSLDGDTYLPDSKEFNQLEGVIFITSDLTNEPPLSYPVKIVAMTGDALVPEGFVAVNPSRDDFYAAMIDSFADIVAEKLPDHMRDAASR